MEVTDDLGNSSLEKKEQKPNRKDSGVKWRRKIRDYEDEATF